MFVRGTDNTVYHRYRNGNAWSPGWVSIGAPPGGVTSAPAAVSSANGRIDLFVRGADSAIWRRTWTITSWGPWTSIGGVATSAPSATSRGTDSIDLFVRGTDGQVHVTTGTPAGWSAWSALGGFTFSAPAAAASSANRIDLWARGPGSALQHKFWQPTRLVGLERELVRRAAPLVRREVRVPLAERTEGRPELALRLLVVE